ncbi:MAG: ABC transporter permease [Bacteroidetes bacterium]|nr:ABC transporter permease [Bacteroidota bacterium]
MTQVLQYAEILLTAMFRVSPPLIFAGLAGMLSFRVGLLNIALEGMLLFGAFTAVIVSYYTSSSLLGLLAAGAVSGVVAYFFALFNFKFKANNIVVGVAINIIALGFTTYLLKLLFGVRGAFSSPDIIGLPIITIPGISSIPLLRTLSGQSLLVYAAIISVIIIHKIYYQTRFGLAIRAGGRHPMCAITAGIDMTRLRYITVILGGVFCGVGGAHLSLGQLTMFTENMTNGRGFIAMAASIFGNSTPLGTLVGALIFSFADGVTILLQRFDFPSYLIQMIPFAATLVILVIVAIRRNVSQIGKISRHMKLKQYI